ncbi:hypothetical protein ABQE93_09125 [Mycolicibacterium sp. XJ662]
MVGVAGLPAAPGSADTPAAVAQAVTQARGASECSPLTYSPELERAAVIINSSTSDYLDHTGENIPADDPHPMPILAELGIEAENVHSLQGAGRDEADAVEGMLLQGYRTIPDCSYTEFGTSGLYEPQSGYFLVVAVMVQK